MNTQPKISVSILTCNRIETLKENLDSLLQQTIIKDCEVLVVDNNSEDTTAEELKNNYPTIKHIKMSENLGCAGRNTGISAATAPIVITLDDDVFLRRDDELERIIDFFDNHPEVSILNFRVLFFDTAKLVPFNWFHPRKSDLYSYEEFETDYISEGAVAFKKEIFNTLDAYPEDFFISHEGYDLAYRALDNDIILYYSGQIEVLHKCAHEQRTTWRNAYYDTRNYIWLLVKYLPISRLIPALIYRLSTTFVFCLLRGQLIWYFRAVYDGIKGLPSQLKKRTPLSNKTFTRLSHIRRYKPSFFFKLKDFLFRTKMINEVLKK